MRRLLCATGVYPPDAGGPARFAAMLEDGLQRSGIQVDVLAFSRWMRLPRGIRHLRFLLSVLAVGRLADVFLALDAVSVGLPTLFAARMRRRPFCLRIGGDFAWEQAVERFGVEEDIEAFQGARYGTRVELLRKVERAVARRAAKVIVPGRFLQGLVRSWGVPEERIVLVPNAVDVSVITETRAEARDALRVQGHLVVSAGRLMRLKGFEALIDVVGELRAEFPDLHLAVIGSGPRHRALVDHVRQAGLDGIVTLLGLLPHASTLLYTRAADLFVLNSTGEGQAHALLEAMALGTPIVATAVGGTRDLIEHDRTGVLIRPKDGAGLREALRRLLRDPAEGARMADAARRAAAGFELGRSVRETVAALCAVA